MNTTAKQIHAILFSTAEPYTFGALAKLLNISESQVQESVVLLQEALKDTGVLLLVQDATITLAVAPEESALITEMQKDAFTKELSKAQGETLAIVAYMGSATKTDIEFIRGVNSVYSIRALVARGLIEAKGSGRSVSYVPTVDLLREFGITNTSELPGYDAQSKKIQELLVANQE